MSLSYGMQAILGLIMGFGFASGLVWGNDRNGGLPKVVFFASVASLLVFLVFNH